MIRHIRVGEAEAVARMSRALAAHHGDEGALVAGRLAHMVAQGWLQVLVAERSGALVGYASLVRTVKTHMGACGLHLDNLYVRDRSRGQGIGRALLVAAREEALRQGCCALSIGTAEGNTAAARLYRASGFAETPRRGRAFVQRF
ncbi:MAG: GNAT family N-acetyltransferase [Pseudomonadota bacterium]